MKKPTLCVIFGGKSSEYEVSLRSAYAVLCHLDKEKYDVVRLGITKGGEWYIYEGENEGILRDSWQGNSALPVALDLTCGNLIVLGKDVYALEIDLFLPVLHGGCGEDGRLQGLLDMAGAKYVGCGAYASHLCMDKHLTKLVARELGVPVAKGGMINAKCKMLNAELTTLPSPKGDTSPCTGEAVGENAKCTMQNAELTTLPSPKGDTSPYTGEAVGVNAQCKMQNAKLEFGYPVFIKPTTGGSSIGAYRVENEGEMGVCLEKALEYGDVLVEELIVGDEVEVGVVEVGGEVVVSPVGMIRHGGRFYDYKTKYESGDNEYLIPAPIDPLVAEEIQGYARHLFCGLGCRGFGRFDFFVKENGRVVFNEVNTLPGFTDASMFPKLFMSMGYSFEELIDTLVAGGLS